MRALGALLVVLGCGSAGFLRTRMLSRQIALLEELCGLLQRVRTELCQRNAPLPEIFWQTGDGRLQQIAADLQRGKSLPQAAQPFVQRLEKHRQLSQSARSLGRLAQVLGRYDSVTQADACTQALEELQVQRDALRRELCEKGSLYRTAPLAFGMIAALAML